MERTDEAGLETAPHAHPLLALPGAFQCAPLHSRRSPSYFCWVKRGIAPSRVPSSAVSSAVGELPPSLSLSPFPSPPMGESPQSKRLPSPLSPFPGLRSCQWCCCPLSLLRGWLHSSDSPASGFLDVRSPLGCCCC